MGISQEKAFKIIITILREIEVDFEHWCQVNILLVVGIGGGSKPTFSGNSSHF